MSAIGSRRADGFTLLEMLVTLGIAALIASLGFPRLQSQITAQEWRTGVAGMTALLRTARAAAARMGTAVTVGVGADGHTARREGAAPVIFPHSVRVAADRPLTFFADGSATAGEVVVEGSRRRAVIDVAPVTGLATAVVTDMREPPAP